MRPSTTRALRRAAAISGTLAVVGLTTVPAFAADDARSGDVKVVNTETVQVYLSPSGHIESKRVYEQLALTGHGSVDLENPVSTSGLRNLDGFSGFDVKDGEQIAKATVDGTKHYRSVSNYTRTLPVAVTPTYKLDGKTVEPGDVVGASGKLQVQFKVENRTTKSQEVSYDDGTGNTVTKTVEVPVPMVGSLTTSVPASFTDVDPGGGNTAGDGTGGQTLSYNLVLFPPLGSTTATVGYTAQITDGVVPRVDVAMLPVDPLSSPTFKAATDGYQGGAKTGAQLVTGADTIDTNLLKLRDGAADLLAGLIKLSDGADQLHTGLADDAAPGAKKLADGTGKALAGSEKLTDGLKQISGGLGQLADQLPAAGPGVQQLVDGVNQIVAGFGAAGQTGTLIDGLTRLQAGAGQIEDGLTLLRNGDGTLTNPGLVGAKAGVDSVQGGLNDAVKDGGSFDQLIGALDLVLSADCGPTCTGIIAGPGGIKQSVQGSKTQLSAANVGLQQISAGLQKAVMALADPLNPAAPTLTAGAGALKKGAGDAKAGAQKLKTGSEQVRDGLIQLKSKLAAAISGVLKLDDGAGKAYDGSGDLADGLGQIDGGANKLADGLGDAADASGQIADGLKKASGGAPQIVDGAGRLSTEGMGQLKQAGEDTAVNYGQMYAVIAAGAERAQTESMAFGAPKGAEGLTAYSFVIRGDDGESSRNLTRAVSAFALLGAGGGVCLLRRRLV